MGRTAVCLFACLSVCEWMGATWLFADGLPPLVCFKQINGEVGFGGGGGKECGGGRDEGRAWDKHRFACLSE